MAALATLTTTTLVNPVSSSESMLILTSVTGIVPDLYLYADRELMKVTSIGITSTAGTQVYVRRGADGTAGAPHHSGALVTIGRGDQFYMTNPVGAATASPLVNPWINVLTGEQWTVQGDDAAPYWARTEYVHTVGAFGVRSSVATTSDTTIS